MKVLSKYGTRIMPALTRVVASVVSKPLMLHLLPLGSDTDEFFAASMTAATIYSVVTSQAKTSYYRTVADSSELPEIRLITSQHAGFILQLGTASGFVALPLVYLYSRIIHASSLGLFILAFSCTYASAIAGDLILLTCNFSRLESRNDTADWVATGVPIFSSIAPLAMLSTFGMNSYLIAISAMSSAYTIFSFWKSSVWPSPPSAAYVSRVLEIFKAMAGVTIIAKLFPFVETYALSIQLPGSLTLYTIAKGMYGSILSVLELGFLQRLIASFQLLLSKSRLVALKHQIYSLSTYSILCCGIGFFPLLLPKEAWLNFSYFIGSRNISDSNTLLHCILALSLFFGASVCSTSLMPLLYALGDFRFVSKIAVPSAFINSVIMIFCANYFGIVGICLSLGVYFSVNTIIFCCRAFHKLNNTASSHL